MGRASRAAIARPGTGRGRALVLSALAAGLLLALASAPALAQIGYNTLARQSIVNQKAAFNLTGDFMSVLFGGGNGFTNARYLGMNTVNSSFSTANSTEYLSQIMREAKSDGQSQTHINDGLRIFGNNASFVQCGQYLGGDDLSNGDCRKNAGKNGTSGLTRARLNAINSNPVLKKQSAESITNLVSSVLTALTTIQKGQVAVLDSGGEIVQ